MGLCTRQDGALLGRDFFGSAEAEALRCLGFPQNYEYPEICCPYLLFLVSFLLTDSLHGV